MMFIFAVVNFINTNGGYISMKNVYRKLLVFIAGAGILFISGCAGFIRPQPGSVAAEDAIVMLDTLGTDSQVWEGEDLTLRYTAAQSGNRLEVNGDILFSRSLTNTFNRARKFNLIMSFVDNQGMVLQSYDIAPFLSMNDIISNKVKFRADKEVPQASVGIVFSYYGVFIADQPTMGTWDIYYFPYNR